MLWCGRGIVWAVWLIVLTCGVPRRVEAAAGSQEMDSDDVREETLRWVTKMTSGNLGATCMTPPLHRFAKVPVGVGRFDSPRQKADLVVRVLAALGSPPDKKLVEVLVGSLVRSAGEVVAARVLVKMDVAGVATSLRLTVTRRPHAHYPPTAPTPPVNTTTYKEAQVMEEPWYAGGSDEKGWNTTKFQTDREDGSLGWWTFPYFDCSSKRWLLSYTAPIAAPTPLPTPPARPRRGRISDLGLVSVDVDVTSLDINQCDPENSTQVTGTQQDRPTFTPYITYFFGTHKCHRQTSSCEPRGGMGLAQGGYVCRCLPDHYPRNKTFNGSVVEVAWEGREEQHNPTYDFLYQCRKCPEECPGCDDNTNCTAHYNWAFRIALLTISSLCMVLTFVLMGLVCHYSSVKVFRLASPTFLCLCLIGCAIMYLEMAAIFPVLDTYSCVATKWTRHLGFCVTFSSLLMKTWRVSLTYRVTSAHKIKLTDKQLLQWLIPLLLIVLVYLMAWTLSATPSAIYIKDYNHLKFKLCKYDWWDHSLAMGEVVFLMWGVKVCFSVRKAESFFDEAKYISWAVYNIALVNIVMVTFHLLIFPQAGPDVKYLFGFLRTQLSTSTTVLLIFGPKFYRIVQGTGDQYDNRARAKGVTASFSLNGLGVMDDEPADLCQENEELKEEIQKLAAQMEFMKIVHMEMNNRHLKPKPGGYFSEKNFVLAAQSPGTKPTTTTTTNNTPTTTTAINTTTTSTAKGVLVDSGNENSSVRLSTGAELAASERV